MKQKKKGDEEFFIELDNSLECHTPNIYSSQSLLASAKSEGAFLHKKALTLSSSSSCNFNTYEDHNITQFTYTGLICASSSLQTIFCNNYASIYTYYESIYSSNQNDTRIVRLGLVDFDPCRNSVLLNGHMISTFLSCFIANLSANLILDLVCLYKLYTFFKVIKLSLVI